MSTTDTKYYLEPVDFDPFAGPEIELVVSMSKPQEEIWLSCLLGGDDANRAYNESVSLRLHGHLDFTALEQALLSLILRHQSLRSTIKSKDGQIVIYQDWPLSLTFTDLSSKPEIERQQSLDQFLQQGAQQVYDLENGPLFRTALFKLSALEHCFVFCAHHIICDGWSLGILLQDLSKYYSACRQGQQPNLPKAPQMSLYIEEQTAFAETGTYQQTKQFWVDQFSGFLPDTKLPVDYPRPAIRTYKSKRADFKLDPQLTLSLKKTGAKKGCSFVVTLLSAFEVLLHKLTGQQEVVTGLPAAGQAASGYYGLTGHCVNLLPIKSFLDNNSSFNTYLEKRKTEILDALEHQQFSLGTLLKSLNIARDPSRVPLVPVVFNIDLNMDDGVAFDGLTYQLDYNPRAYETFEIFLNASGTEQGLTLEWSYNTQLFKNETIAWMMQSFRLLLQNLVEQPDRLISTVQLLPPNGAITGQKNSPVFTPYPQVALHELISLSLKKHAVKTAIRFHTGSISHAELLSKANRFAALLIKKGVQKGDLVAVALDRSIEMVVTLLAILKSGAAYVPIDPTYPQARIRYMLQDSGAKLLVVNSQYQDNFSGSYQKLVLEEAIAALSLYADADPQIKTEGEDLAYVLYTSGSTGKPKGVQIAHHSIVNLLHSIQTWPGISPNDKMLAISTISFDIAGLELFLPLISGAEMVLADTQTAKDGHQLLNLIKNSGVTLIQATPVTFRLLLEAGWNDKIAARIFCCGEALQPDLAKKLLGKCAGLWNMYGPTETTIYSTGKEITDAGALITIGRPIHNTQVFILDEALNLVPDSVTGEIFIAGEGVAQGYLNQPELTASRFPEDKFTGTAGKKMYRTGDVGRILPNGEIEYLGRTDHQVKIRGYRVELGEIEQQLSRLENITQAVVIADTNAPDNPQLRAFVTAPAISETDQKKWADTWKTALKEALPAFMVPVQIAILPRFPLTPNNKIDRKALLNAAAAVREDVKVAPGTGTEKLISDIWHQVLGLQNISIYDNFFEIGGHSLTAIQIMNSIEKETGKRLPIATLFQFSTISALSGSFETGQYDISKSSLIPIKPTGNKTPVYMIHGSGSSILNFSNVALYVDAEQPVYGLQAKGLYGNEQPLTTMEEIAAYYISEIFKQNPTGPYALAGYSFGGYVAIEMVRQLKLLGKEIKMLAMIDTNAEEFTSDKSVWAKAKIKLARQFKKIAWISSSLMKDPKTTINYQLYFLVRKIKSIAEFLGFTKEEAVEGHLLELQRIAEQNDIAYYNYKIKPFDGKIDVFKAQKRIYFIDDFKFLGWKKYALKGVAIHDVPGDHKTMLQPPNDKEFARVLQNRLNQPG